MESKILLKRRFEFDSLALKFNANTKWQIDPKIRGQADKLWQEKQIDYAARGVKVWDGDYYRLDNLHELIATANNQPITLELSVIKYRYVNTIRDFESYYESNPDAYPNHISVGAIIKTTDNKWVFGVRGISSINSGNVDLIGGGLNPNELEIDSGAAIYRNLLKEFKEEIGVSPEHVRSTVAIGILHSVVANVLLIGLTELNITSVELAAVFKTKTDDEMQALLFVEDKDLKEYMAKMPSYRALIPELLG